MRTKEFCSTPLVHRETAVFSGKQAVHIFLSLRLCNDIETFNLQVKLTEDDDKDHKATGKYGFGPLELQMSKCVRIHYFGRNLSNIFGHKSH